MILTGSAAVTFILRRMAAMLALASLAACATPKDAAPPEPEGTLPGYEAVVDGGFEIKQVDLRHLSGDRARAIVHYTGTEAPGTIVVDIHSRRLYHVMEGGFAMRYAIAVGREGLSFTGTGVIGRMAKWPSWQPTANMIKTRPDLYLEYAAGMQGGPKNPLGARAMYLYRNGRDTMFRIHGTIDNPSIGMATSAGCIRLYNQDAIELYSHVKPGTVVKVRTLEESLAAEGPYMDDARGLAVPDTEANRLKLAEDLAAMAAAEAAAAEAALKAQQEALTASN
jgi:lipoprotein-anchoring transpeptidase ErfK/SrfK